MKKLAAAVLAVWIGRWALRELASFVANRWLPPGPPAKDSLRQPGRIPGPFDA